MTLKKSVATGSKKIGVAFSKNLIYFNIHENTLWYRLF